MVSVITKLLKGSSGLNENTCISEENRGIGQIGHLSSPVCVGNRIDKTRICMRLGCQQGSTHNAHVLNGIKCKCNPNQN